MARCKGSRAALIVLALSSAALALPSSAGAVAAIVGSVTLPQRLPPPLPNPRYQTKSGAPVGLPDPPAAVVFVEAPAPAQSDPAHRAELAQHHYQFAPGLLAIERGSKVAFPRSTRPDWPCELPCTRTGEPTSLMMPSSIRTAAGEIVRPLRGSRSRSARTIVMRGDV